jgi:hypothetical protein
MYIHSKTYINKNIGDRKDTYEQISSSRDPNDDPWKKLQKKSQIEDNFKNMDFYAENDQKSISTNDVNVNKNRNNSIQEEEEEVCL